MQSSEKHVRCQGLLVTATEKRVRGPALLSAAVDPGRSKVGLGQVQVMVQA